MIKEAIRLGCPEIGFSVHSPIPEKTYCITPDRIGEYMHTVRELGERYSSSIRVYLGIELDLISELDTSGFDYVIGSVHGVIPDGRFHDVDHTADITRAIINELYGGDPYAYVEDYYAELRSLYSKTHCDIIGHFDLITKFIECDPVFSTSHPRYTEARDSAFSELIRTPAIFEVNTGAISRGYRSSPYPEDAVLMKIKEAGKRVVINSDAHAVSGLGCMMEESARHLDALGIGYYTSLSELLADSRGAVN